MRYSTLEIRSWIAAPAGQVRHRRTQLPSSRPQPRIRHRPQPIPEWDGLLAGVDHDAALEALAAGVAQGGEPLPVTGGERGAGLDLDGCHVAGAVFKDEIDILAVALVVIQTNLALRPGRGRRR